MKVIEIAEKNLKGAGKDKELGAKNAQIVAYWGAYLDGAKDQYKEDHNENFVMEVAKLTTGLCECVANYTKQMNNLIDSVKAELNEINEDEE